MEPFNVYVQLTDGDLTACPDGQGSCLPVLKDRPEVNQIIFAAPESDRRDRLERLAGAWGATCFFGADYDVAGRLAAAAETCGDTEVARVLLHWNYIDADLIVRMVAARRESEADFVKLPLDFNYTYGADVTSREALGAIPESRSGDNVQDNIARFNPWGYIEKHPEDFKVIDFMDVPTYEGEKVDEIIGMIKARAIGHQSACGHGFLASRYRFVHNYIEPGMRVIDVACGAGEGSRLMAEKAEKVFGVELMSEMIVARPEENLFFIGGDAQNLNFLRERYFDAAVSLHTMEHLADDSAFLSGIRDRLKDGGLFILEVPLELKRPVAYPNHPFHLREYDAKELESMLGDYSFTVERSFGISRRSYVDPSLAREGIQFQCRKVSGD
ncbi:methyltransferase domain-containing protein [candidate division KSB1 bacterium]